jgi:hypothetical protein
MTPTPGAGPAARLPATPPHSRRLLGRYPARLGCFQCRAQSLQFLSLFSDALARISRRNRTVAGDFHPCRLGRLLLPLDLLRLPLDLSRAFRGRGGQFGRLSLGLRKPALHHLGAC